MKITNCNCGKLVDCGCTLSFDTWQNNTVSVLSVGNLTGGSCVLDEYVIDWYRDGHHSMVSGKGYDPDIQSFHPFNGLSAVPVEPGQWKPILRYVVIGGEKLYAQKHKCQSWCMDLQAELPSISVPFITVSALSCGFVGQGNNAPSNSNYDFAVRYETSQDFALAQRTIRMLLSPDGSTGYLAMLFIGFNVADQIKAYYHDEPTPLSAYVVGSNLPANNPIAVPQEIDYSSAGIVVNFQAKAYQPGDYITIKITPAVKEHGNFNTNWLLNLKCLPRNVFECDLFHQGLRTIDTERITLSWVEQACRYELFLATADKLGSNYPTTYFSRYLAPLWTAGAQTTSDNIEGWVKIILRKSITASGPVAYSTSLHTNMQGEFLATKTGNILTFEFTRETDYQAFKSSHAAVTNLAAYQNYSADPANYHHYKYFYLVWRETMLTCGDAFTTRSQRFHITSPITFDDSLKKITIEMLNVANGYTQVECDGTFSTISSFISMANSDINIKADWSGSSRCRNTYPFNLTYVSATATIENARILGGYWYLHLQSLNTVCDLQGWQSLSNGNFIYRMYYVRVTLTNPADALNNFRVESQLDIVTGALTGTWVTIYEKQNGNQIIP